MAIFSTVMSIAAAFVPETHGPTLLAWRIKREGNAPPPLSAAKIIRVYKTALSRPFIYIFTGQLLCRSEITPGEGGLKAGPRR